MIAYQRRDLTDGDSWTDELDLPEQPFTTQAFWLTCRSRAGPHARRSHRDRRPGDPRVPARRRACAHRSASALRDVRPLGYRRPQHAVALANRTASIFVYDGYPGGIGLSRRGYDAFESLADARDPGRRVPLRERLPELRPESQVRQPEPAVKQGRRRCLARCRSGGRAPLTPARPQRTPATLTAAAARSLVRLPSCPTTILPAGSRRGQPIRLTRAASPRPASDGHAQGGS